MTVAIHQPDYIPWLGYFYKIYHCDIFVFHDDVQFSKSRGHNYRNIKTHNGLKRLKIPINFKHPDRINEVVMKDSLKWREEHLRLIEINYQKAAFFNQIFGDLIKNYKFASDSLSNFNINFITSIARKFGFNNKFILASDLNLYTKKEQKVIDIVKSLNGNVYYSGTGAKAYQDSGNFEKEGIRLTYSDFNPFKYEQLWGEFEHNVSVIDYLMNYGYDWNFILESLVLIKSHD